MRCYIRSAAVKVTALPTLPVARTSVVPVVGSGRLCGAASWEALGKIVPFPRAAVSRWWWVEGQQRTAAPHVETAAVCDSSAAKNRWWKRSLNHTSCTYMGMFPNWVLVARLGVPAAATMWMIFFWDVALCNMVVYLRFGGVCCLLLIR